MTAINLSLWVPLHPNRHHAVGVSVPSAVTVPADASGTKRTAADSPAGLLGGEDGHLAKRHTVDTVEAAILDLTTSSVDTISPGNQVGQRW